LQAHGFLARGAFAFATAIAAFAALLAVPAPPARAVGDCTVSDAALDSQEQAFLGLINSYRANYGAGPLSASGNLNEAAAWMAHDMGEDGYFDHLDNESPRRWPSGRTQACGYTGTSIGENIAAGYSTPQAVVAGWMGSSGHCANIMSAGYRSVGVGYANIASSPYGYYWTQDFGGQ